MSPADVDVVFADGAAQPGDDRVEAEAIAAVFGPRAVPVTVPKAGAGRLCAGAGALDLATALLALRDGVIPPTANVVPSPGYELDLVTEARPAPLSSALVLARGAGGFTAAMIVRSL
jgi:act minimal PKS chain-length factor (CLF/KS beta)